MAGPWEKYQQHAAGDQPQPIQDGPWAKYQAPARDEVAANDATADHGGIQASDFGKEVAGGALVGTGAVVSGVGDLLTTAGTALERGARTVLPNGAVDALKSIPAPSDLLFRPVGRQIESAGKGIQDTKSEAAKQALEASTPQGDILDPSSWSMGDDPSLAGYGLQASNLIGQFVPQAVALAIPGGQARMAGMAGVGGLQAGGAAGNEEEQRIAALPDAELQQASELYRELRGSGMDEATARAQVSATARAAAFQGAAPVGAVGGAMTNYALGPLQRLIGGGVGRRLAGGLFLDAPAEGAQEVSEAVAARAATNRAIGERRDLTEDTFADAVLGAMGGAGHATLGAALGRPQPQARPADPAAEADATFDDTPQTAALPAPGLQGLPAPEQTFYADSQGNMQGTGPVRNVDGEMQPDQQGRQWINPRNRADRPVGGEGMEREVARGEPAPLVGQFQHGSRQQVADTGAQQGLTLEGEVQQMALPAPEAIVVDGQGNAQRGATAPQVFERAPSGGRGMDRQREAGKTYKGLPAANRAIRESANPEQLEAVKVGPQTFEVRPKAAEQNAQRPVLQNRDRSTPASITQMRSIAARPDYQRVSISRDFANGAPVVEPGAAVPSSRKGRTEVVSTASGRKINTQYAVVEASDLLPSHDINGGQNAEYATGAQGKSRAIAGNGRVTGISHAYTQGTAGEYRRELEADAAGHGISPEAIKGMKQPVLVRIMPQDQITQDIGDESNTATVSALSAAEQARNDAARIDAANMAFDDNGEISEATVRQFIQSMPEAERGGLLDGGRPSRQAYDRAASAVFASAYESDELIRLQAQATDPEARTVLSGLLAAASKMTRLKGQGQWDIRGLVVEAAQAAVNATRNGQTLAAYAQQFDIERNPEATYFIDLFAANSRSGKRIGEQLSAIADTFYAEAAKPEFDMFGAVPRRSRQEILGELNGTAEGQRSSAQPTGQQAGPGTTEASRPAAAVDEGEPAGAGADAQAEAFQLNQQTEEELAAADAANKARIKAEEKAQAEAEQKALADRDRNDFTLTGSDRPSDVAAARGQNDMFAPQTRGEKKAAERASAPAVEPDGFIKAPDGSLDFGEITPEMAQAAGRQAGKIRLQQGNESWGLQHVELRHGAEIRDAGFADVPAFVADIAQHIDQVWKPAATRQLVALHAAGKNRVMFVELQPGRDESGDFYTVKTAFPARPGYTKKENWKLLWEARAQASGESGNRPSFAVSPPVAGGEVTIPSSQSSEASIAPPAGGKPAADQAGGRPAESKIEDAGEKLGGARKDQLRTVRDRLDDMGDEEIAGSSLSQLWPKGELDKISDPFEAALYHVVRGLIPAKPRVSDRVKAWVGKVKAARDILTTLGGIGANATAEKMRAYSPGLGTVADQIEVLMALDRKHWGRIDNIRRAHGRYNQDGEMVPGSWVSLNIDGRQVSFYGHESVASAIPAIKDRVEGKDAPEKRMKFAIYTDRQTGDVFVVKEGDAEMRRLKTFKSVKEARAFLNDEYEAAVALWDAVKNRDNVTKSDMRRSTNDPRVGQNHRDGKDVTPEQFLAAFGFRGVEFGNWVKQGAGGRDRQGMLNDAYDAFMDLASILNIPPKALSLEGKLGIGFGSRGSGKASAHFEPGNIVINLTKTKGAGSLAHEWFHAIDNYFARKRERPVESVGKAPDRQEAYITYRPEPLLVNKKHPTMRMTRAELSRYQANHPNAPLYAEGNWEPDQNHPKGVRPQVEKAFAELVATLNASPMLQRAKVIDGKTSDGYWSRIIERGARSFETYVIARLADQGFRNDYLANVQTLEQFARDPGRYPYLTPDEQGPVNEAFDKLFATIETRETDSGVSLYRLDDGESGQLQADAVTQALAASPELAGVKVVQSFDDLPLSARIRATRDGIAPDELRGIYSSGATYVVAGNHASVADALYTAVHEEVGHRGIHGLLGDRLDATMERLYTSQAATTKGRQRIAQIRQAYAKVLEKLDARKQRLMIAEEMVALLIEDGERPTALQRVLSKMRELLRALVPQVPWTYTDILALGEQSRRWLRDNQAGTTDGERALYALGGKRQHTSEAFSDLTAKQKEALNKIAPRTAKQQAIEWFRQQSDRALLKIRQGIVDRYAALRDLDEAVHGKDVLSTDIASSAWVLARMSSAASGALHAMLNNGRIYLDQQQKVIDIQDGEALGLGATLARLGSAAEIERFMGWIAGNRSAKLAAEGRENLFDAAEIDALRTLNRGTTEHGKARGALYNEVFAEFQQYRDDVLAIAEHAGVITPESRALWRDEFYVPFYRVMDEDAAAGPMASKGLTRQEAYKKLKGGNQNLNDLLQNTLLNFNHLLQASLKNQAAAQAIDNAEQLGIAQPVSEAARDKKASTFVLKAGVKQWYNIGDPLVFEALSSLSDAGLNNAAVRAMSFFKRLFTNMTTITPQFIIANLLRDSMSATATSPVSKNFVKNIVAGGKDWTNARKRARMLASGGAFSFGHIYSNDPDEVKAHIKRNLRSAKLIDGPKLVPQALKAGWDTWNSVANTAENANRAAIFEQNEQGRGKLAAAFEARDLMDFSMHGAWPAVRFLIRVVPFLNARLQGLDKLYRAGVKPSLLTAFGQGSASDKQAAARFMTVVAALSLASMALLLVNNDDEEYRKLEEWEKDTYWNFFIGGMHWRIPKPFEVGAIATMAERLLQQAIDDKATGKLFAQRLWHALTQTFSFSPVPHMFQPVLDVYSNVDAFTGRPIESTGMHRLSKGLRTRATTTAPAHALSAVSRVFGDEFPLAVSPIQADHLIAGYLGQVGAWGAGMVDTMWRAANGESQPAKHWHEYQPIRRFYRDLDTPAAYTRYSTIFYEGLREAGKAYADVKELQELGRMDEAREVIREKRDLLGVRKQLNQVQRRLTAINGRMDAVRLGELDADAKRRELDRLLVIKNRLTEMAGKRLEDMRAKR